ncbi:MAG: helix-turn-helix transcriptional regulator [Phycisphaerales bacterium]|nr:helix-turn-helix transcriptional regulator [Phycisphaerales bacterium]MCB9840334.1 helix-turn-helix transcriptional regulator [Phycisphaeraceae bacterium]
MRLNHSDSDASHAPSRAPGDGAGGSPAPSRVLLREGAFAVAHHRCPPEDHRWQTENQVVTGHLVVFPWSVTMMRPDSREHFVADPNSVLFWNRGEVFRRDLVSDRGDESALFAVDSSLAVEMLAAHDPSVREHPEAPFRVHRAPSDPRLFLLQASIMRAAMSGEAVDGVEWQEATLTLVRHAIRGAYTAVAQAGRRRPAARRRMQWEAVEATRALLASRWDERLSLAMIAERIGFSAYHLCRVFRAGTGRSLHEYLTQLRLRGALERMASMPQMGLEAVADSCGFANHSHLTRAFRGAFGVTPSAARRLVGEGRIKELGACLSLA